MELRKRWHNFLGGEIDVRTLSKVSKRLQKCAKLIPFFDMNMFFIFLFSHVASHSPTSSHFPTVFLVGLCWASAARFSLSWAPDGRVLGAVGFGRLGSVTLVRLVLLVLLAMSHHFI